MKIGSMTATATAASRVTFIARRAAPAERSSAAQPMPSAISGRDGEVMRRYMAASARVSPSACSRPSSGARAMAVAIPMTSVSAAIAIRLVVPMRWASPGVWLPMAAETVAPMPMVRPIAIEIWKKLTAPAKPTAAAMGFSPRREM
jgi:hypothetical protein